VVMQIEPPTSGVPSSTCVYYWRHGSCRASGGERPRPFIGDDLMLLTGTSAGVQSMLDKFGVP
jgi:hypothetical protein